MTEIDQTTGLPQAPDNMWWRVAPEHSYRPFHDFERSLPTGPNVKLMSRQLLMPTVDLPRTFLDSLLGRRRTSIRTKDYDYLEAMEFIRNSEGEYIDRLDITPDLIIKTCESILERVQKKIEANKYLGDYPPNKLEN